MANVGAFKNLGENDIVSTRTLLHEAIPLTGTIVSGTYNDNNIKFHTHGMFQTVYDILICHPRQTTSLILPMVCQQILLFMTLASYNIKRRKTFIIKWLKYL